MARSDACERTWGPLLAARRAGSIDPADADGLEEHLAGCKRCRALAADIDVLRALLVEGARRGPFDHPEPEALAALAAGALAAEERERIERHVEACESCRSEWVAARAFSPPALGSGVLPERGRPWVWFGAGVATTALAASLAALLLLPVGLDRGGGGIGLRPSAEPVQLRGEHHRAGDEPTALILPDSGELLVSLTVESAPGSALRVELFGSDGSVRSSARFVLDDPAGLLFVSIPAASVPPTGGEFRVSVETTGEAFHYPFRVVTGED